jgi:hypothetical protein
VYSDNKLYLLLLSLRFGVMTKRFILTTNRKLILELPTYLVNGFKDYVIAMLIDGYQRLKHVENERETNLK